MWRRIFLALVLVCLSISCMGSRGCSLDEAEENLGTVQGLTTTVTPYVPTTHTYIPAGISALATAALTIIKIIKEKKETQRMKKAIKAVGKVIDHGKFNKSEEVRKGTATILELFGSAKTINNPGMREDLLLADAVRKNLR